MEEFGTSRKYVLSLLQKEPNNRQALELESLIRDRVTKDGLVGLAIAGGAAVAIAATGVLLAKWPHRCICDWLASAFSI